MHKHHGISLVEMMVALTVGLLVVLAAGALLQQARMAYQEMEDEARVQETGRMVLDHLARALRQTGHLPWEILAPDSAAVLSAQAGLRGLDNNGNAAGMDPAGGVIAMDGNTGINGSDLLMLGAAGATASAANGMRNCSGAAIPASEGGISSRAWDIYSIAYGAGNEPELRCRYRGKSGVWSSDAIARGVESLQLLYAVDNEETHALQWLRASQISGAQWRRVVLVRMGILVRGEHVRPSQGTPRSFEVLRDDPDSRFTEPAGERRIRRVFQQTVYLDNQTVDSP